MGVMKKSPGRLEQTSRGSLSRRGILSEVAACSKPNFDPARDPVGPQGRTARAARLRVYSPAEEPGPIKRTYQPKKKYRRRVHGFLRRMNTAAGARLIRNRRRKGRHRLTPA